MFSLPPTSTATPIPLFDSGSPVSSLIKVGEGVSTKSKKVGASVVAAGDGVTTSFEDSFSLSHPLVHSVGERVGDSEGAKVGALVLDLWRIRWRRLLRRWAPLSVAVDGVRASAVSRIVIVFIVDDDVYWYWG